MAAYAAAHRLAPSSQKAISPNLCPLLTSAVTIAAVSSRRQFLGPCALCGDPLDEALTPEHCRGRDDNSAQQTTQQREDTDRSSCRISWRVRRAGGGCPIDGPAGAGPGRGCAQCRGGPE